MAVDPNEMLIFKARKPQHEVETVQKPAGSQPKSEARKERSAAIANEAPVQAAPAVAEAQQQTNTTAQLKNEAKAAEQRKMIPGSERTLDKYQFGKPPERVRVGQIPEEAATSPVYALSDKGFMARGTPEKIAIDSQGEKFGAPSIAPKAKTLDEKPLTKKESVDAAKGQSCFWHSWRPAYGICAVCKKPYCYEDIVEYGGSLYCLAHCGSSSTFIT